jgi:hypothetical protein
MPVEPQYHTLGAKLEIAPSTRRHDFSESLRVFLDMWRNEGMTDLGIRDALRAKVVELNEAEQDVA